VRVTLSDHRVLRAKVIGGDPTTDVAVIKIDGRDLPTTVMGEDSTTRVGDWVMAVGNPLGLDFTVTAGIVSAKGRSGRDLPGLLDGGAAGPTYSISDFLQTDAAINPGNSGGPLVNTRGEVIGINSAIASRTGFYSGYGFAIPISLARTVMDDLIKHGRVRAPVLGVAINEVSPEDAKVAGLQRIEGVLVQGFNPAEGSPAEQAGLEIGDVIVAADGRPVERVSALQRVVRTREPGETIALDVMRFGQRRSFKVRLQERRETPEVVAAANPGGAPGARTWQRAQARNHDRGADARVRARGQHRGGRRAASDRGVAHRSGARAAGAGVGRDHRGALPAEAEGAHDGRPAGGAGRPQEWGTWCRCASSGPRSRWLAPAW
jgi:serine protease Do